MIVKVKKSATYAVNKVLEDGKMEFVENRTFENRPKETELSKEYGFKVKLIALKSEYEKYQISENVIREHGTLVTETETETETEK